MEIFYKKKLFKKIENHKDLEKFLIEFNFFKFFKKIPNQYINIINIKINQTDKINFKEVKKWYRGILNYPESIYNEKFLSSMGWSLVEIKKFISEKQKENSKILSDKKLRNPELFYDKTPKRIEYWMKKGFSEKESIEIISKSQKTFSKNLCIEKYGLEKGLEIFNARQLKWVNSLHNNNNISEFKSKQNSYLYDKKKIEELISRTSFLGKTKENILECIKKENINDFIECLLSKIDVKSLSDIIPYLNSTLISKHYKIDRNSIKKIFFDYVSDKLSSGFYGQPVYHNGLRFKSIKEYRLCLLLEENKIDYVYEKQYPNSHFKSDFYLPNLNLYIEYFGILDSKNFDNLDEKQLKYYDKMIQKILFCDNNKINLIYDTNFSKLYEKIKNII